MKIALCFSGQLRFVNEYSKYVLENIINIYDTDVYAHLWWNESMFNKPFHHAFDDLYKETVDDFIKIYKPKQIKIEKEYPSDIIDEEYTYKSRENDMFLTVEQCKKYINTQKSQFHSVRKCFQLIENPQQYDFIIRLRTDCHIVSPLNLHMLKAETLYIQNGFCAGRDRKFCDWFAVGSP